MEGLKSSEQEAREIVDAIPQSIAVLSFDIHGVKRGRWAPPEATGNGNYSKWHVYHFGDVASCGNGSTQPFDYTNQGRCLPAGASCDLYRSSPE